MRLVIGELDFARTTLFDTTLGKETLLTVQFEAHVLSDHSRVGTGCGACAIELSREFDCGRRLLG